MAIILSAQSTDKGVNKATEKLFQVAHTPDDVLDMGETKFKTYIKTIGLYNMKAKNIMKTAKMLVENHGSKVPEDFKDLIALPGVGSKTAKVFLNTLHKKPMVAVDTHVFRVARRIGLSNKTTRPKVEQELEELIPLKWKLYASHWMVLHGRYICKARNPLCDRCPIAKYCNYFKKYYTS